MKRIRSAVVEGRLPRFRCIALTGEQSVFYPFCGGDDIDCIDEVTEGLGTYTELWRCRGCKGQFRVKQIVMLVYEQAPALPRDGQSASRAQP